MPSSTSSTTSSIDLPQRHLTFVDGPHSESAAREVVEAVSTPSASRDTLAEPFVQVTRTHETRPSARRLQSHRRSRPHRPPSLDLRCSSSNASASEHESALGIDYKLSASSAATYTFEKPPLPTSSISSEFDHTWLPPILPIDRMNSVRSHGLVKQENPPLVRARPTLATLCGIARRRDFLLIGIPAALASVAAGLVPATLTKILREAFDAFARYNPRAQPVGSISEEAKQALRSSITGVVWQMALLALAAAILNLCAISAWTFLGERTASRARRECYTAVSDKEMAWFDKGMGSEAKDMSEADDTHGPAAFAAAFSRNADDIHTAYASSFYTLIRASTTAGTAFVLAFKHSWKLAAVTLAAVPVAVLLTALCERASSSLIEAERSALSESSHVIQQALSGITVVKAFNGQARELKRLQSVLVKSSRAWNRTSFVWSLRAGIASSLMLAMFVQGFWYGSHAVQSGEATAGLVMNVFWSCLLVTTSIENALRALLPLQKGKIAAAAVCTICTVQPSGSVWIRKGSDQGGNRTFMARLRSAFGASAPQSPPTTVMRIDAIPHRTTPTSPITTKLSLDQTSPLTTSPKSLMRSKSARVAAMRKVRPQDVCHGELSFRTVSFAYPSRPGTLALFNADIFVPAGETTFIVGGSGSGKTTIANLLLQLYKPLSGEILVNNQDLSYLDPNWFLENILVLSQSPVVFDMTVHDNIAVGKTARAKVLGTVDPSTGIPIVSREDVITASRTALLHEFILSLPDGYDTVLGNKGVNLSTGQKQRLAIARARLCDPKILVLDEATSALDPLSRLLVQEAVRTWRAKATTVFITHDLTQVGADDYTYVMENGRTVEHGYRRHLERRRDGKLQALLKVQAKLRSQMIVPQSIGEELPTSPTGLEAQATVRLGDTLRSIDWELSAARLSMGLASVETLSFRPLSVALTTASPMLGSRRSSMIFPGPEEEKGSGLASAELSTEAEWLHKTGNAAAHGRINKARRLAPREVANLHEVATEQPGQHQHDSQGEKRVDMQPGGAQDGLLAVSRQAWTQQPKRLATLCGMLACVASGCTMPIFSYLLAQLLSTMAATGQSHKVLQYALLTLLVAILDGVCLFLRQFVMESVAESWIRRLREVAFGRVLRQGMGWFNQTQNRPDRIAHCLVRDGEDARDLVGSLWGQLLAVATMLLVAFLWALAVGWELTFVGLAFIPVFAVVVFLQSRALAHRESINKVRRDTVTKRFFDMTANIRAIRSMALDQIFLCRFLEADNACAQSGIRSGPVAGLGAGLAEGLVYLAEGVLFYVGAVLIVGGRYDFGRMITVFNLMVFAVTFSSQILLHLPSLSKSTRAAFSLGALTQLPYDTEEYQGNARARLDGAVEFDNVSFTYGDERLPVLRSLSFKVFPGQTVAVVGSSGCGKTTVLSLLQRLFEPTQGTIKVSGIPIEQLEVGWLREHMSVVSQAPCLFDMTVSENIEYGDNDFPQPLLTGEGDHSAGNQLRTQGAAAWAQMDRTIRRFPAGYATRLGEEGAQLSLGQAQRVAVARALMRRYAKILILDEFTSSLDRARQADLIDLLVLRQHAATAPDSRTSDGREFPRWFQERDVSVLVVTHSLEVMQRCDRILMLSEGRVVQDGTFEQLIATEGEFATLARGGEWGFGRSEAGHH